MPHQSTDAALEELRRLIQDKERELSELDLILADYQTERYRLIRKLRRLRAQLLDQQEADAALPGP